VNWIADQKLSPEPTAPLPSVYANVLIGERFGKWPEECESRPADRALFYNGILSIEGEAHRMIHDLHPGDSFIYTGDD
jgi:hypothetical protein